MFELIEPVVAHCFNDTIADDDQPSIDAGVGEMLVNGERRNVDEITALPFEPLWLFVPIPRKGVEAVEFQIPMQIVTGAFGDENNLLPHMPMLAGAFAGLKELHIGLDAALLGVETVVNEVLDETVRRTLERHVSRADDIRAGLVFSSEFLGRHNIIGAEAARFRTGLRYVALFQGFAHNVFLLPISQIGWWLKVFVPLWRLIWWIRDDFLKQEVHEKK